MIRSIRNTATIVAMSLALGGCANLATMLAANPTVVNIVDGIRAACNWEASQSDIQLLLNSGIPGLKTVDNYVGAFCAAAAQLPVASTRSAAAPVVVVGSVPVRATRK